jgi:hypothetical protein
MITSVLLMVFLMIATIGEWDICSAALPLPPAYTSASCVVISLATQEQLKERLQGICKTNKYLLGEEKCDEISSHSSIRPRASSQRFGVRTRPPRLVVVSTECPNREYREDEAFTAEEELKEPVFEVGLGHVFCWLSSPCSFHNSDYDRLDQVEEDEAFHSLPTAVSQAIKSRSFELYVPRTCEVSSYLDNSF